MEPQNTTTQNTVNEQDTQPQNAVIQNDTQSDTQKVNVKKKILVIDDDENLTMVLVDKLNFSGFDADFASDGVQGLKKAVETKPDLILLDVVMPNMSGWETLEKLRVDSWGEDVKVIMLTSLDKPESIAHATEQGITFYIVKTNFTLDQIVEKVKEVLLT
jgi:DNA-binding response OmpR family regulator